MDVSFLSTATAEASELYQNVGRVIGKCFKTNLIDTNMSWYTGVSLLGRPDNETPKVKFVIGLYSFSGQNGT